MVCKLYNPTHEHPNINVGFYWDLHLQKYQGNKLLQGDKRWVETVRVLAKIYLGSISIAEALAA